MRFRNFGKSAIASPSVRKAARVGEHEREPRFKGRLCGRATRAEERGVSALVSEQRESSAEGSRGVVTERCAPRSVFCR